MSKELTEAINNPLKSTVWRVVHFDKETNEVFDENFEYLGEGYYNRQGEFKIMGETVGETK